MSHKDNTVRFTVDFPQEQHIFLKMLAAKEGKSLKQLVIEHLPHPYTGEDNKPKIKKKKFNALLDEILTDYKEELKNLADR